MFVGNLAKAMERDILNVRRERADAAKRKTYVNLTQGPEIPSDLPEVPVMFWRLVSSCVKGGKVEEIDPA